MDHIKITSDGHGYNTHVELNGQPLDKLESITFDASANTESVVNMKFVGAHVEIDGDVKIENVPD